eukprot:3263625-Alexandrium_andersonii.AAC.1
MVADHIVSLAAMVRAIPPAHMARRAVGWGLGGTPRHISGRAAQQPHLSTRAHSHAIMCHAQYLEQHRWRRQDEKSPVLTSRQQHMSDDLSLLHGATIMKSS